MKHTILIDFDGVIRHWPNAELDKLHDELNINKNALFSSAFSEELLTPAITGKVSHEQWCDAVRSRLAEHYDAEVAGRLVDTWYSLESEIDFEFLNGIRSLAKNRQLVLVTNATSRLEADLAISGLSNAFDQIMNSSELGVEKPKALFFRLVLDRLHVQAEHCLFIDDSTKNVNAAKKMGIDGWHHSNSKQTLEFMSQHFRS